MDAQDAVSDLIGAAAQHGGPSRPVGGEQGGGKKDDPVAFRLAALEVFYGHPDPGVFSWMDSSEAAQFAAMARVARFVEWLRAVFALHKLTPCWSLHPGVVLELWALERLHHATHVATTEPSAPTAFYNQLAVVRARLRTEGEMSTCRTEHTPPIPEPVEAVERRRATYDVPERVSARWAWPGIDDAGLAVPDPERLRLLRPSEAPTDERAPHTRVPPHEDPDRSTDRAVIGGLAAQLDAGQAALTETRAPGRGTEQATHAAHQAPPRYRRRASSGHRREYPDRGRCPTHRARSSAGGPRACRPARGTRRCPGHGRRARFGVVHVARDGPGTRPESTPTVATGTPAAPEVSGNRPVGSTDNHDTPPSTAPTPTGDEDRSGTALRDLTATARAAQEAVGHAHAAWETLHAAHAARLSQTADLITLATAHPDEARPLLPSDPTADRATRTGVPEPSTWPTLHQDEDHAPSTDNTHSSPARAGLARRRTLIWASAAVVVALAGTGASLSLTRSPTPTSPAPTAITSAPATSPATAPEVSDAQAEADRAAAEQAAAEQEAAEQAEAQRQADEQARAQAAEQSTTEQAPARAAQEPQRSGSTTPRA